MKHHPRQLEIDFNVPVKDPLTVDDIKAAMHLSAIKIHQEIQEGRLEATMAGRESAERPHYIIPLKNYIAWLNNEYADELYFRFPAANLLSVECAARAMACSHQHIRNLIRDREFPRVQNYGRSGKETHFMIPLADFVAFINRRRVGDYFFAEQKRGSRR